MSQNSAVLPTTGTVSGLTMTQNMNLALDSLLTNFSGSSAPAPAQAGQYWVDTSVAGAFVLKQRNSANTAWITIGKIDLPNLGAAQRAGDTFTGDVVIPSLNGGPLAGTRNRIINGAMLVDQRNIGAGGLIPVGAFAYIIDRFFGSSSNTGTSTFTAFRDTSTAPPGFYASLRLTTTTAAAALAADARYLGQCIEGVNTVDLAWGTASAKAVTVSFWAKSSLTGTFSGSVSNSAFNRCYPFAYTIATANTWQYFSVTIPGDTSPTWLGDSGIGIRLAFNVGTGSTGLGTANAWASTGYFGTTGSVGITATAGATWAITGIQLEAGSTATPFEQRHYGTELMLCQRYYERIAINTTSQDASNGAIYGAGGGFKVQKRASPTGSVRDASDAVAGQMSHINGGVPITGVTVYGNVYGPVGPISAGGGVTTGYNYCGIASFSCEL
jgi:hypothetical protein